MSEHFPEQPTAPMQSLFDELESATSATAQATVQPASTAHTSERALLDVWTARLLSGVVVPYCRGLAARRLHRACWWVDGLTSSSKTGKSVSAGAFVEAATALAGAGFALRGLHLEPPRVRPKRGASGEVAAATETRGKPEAPALPTLASITPGALPEQLGNAPAMLLLDPLAAPLTTEDLLPLCQRQAPTELLLLISAAKLERLANDVPAGTPVVQEALASDAPAGTAALQGALTALLRSDAWKGIWARPDNRAEKVRRTLELLRALLKPAFLHVCLAPLGEQPIPAPRHYLLFASRQDASVALVSDYLCAEQARVLAEREARALQGTWFARRREKARAAAWAALKEELYTLGRERRARLWPELKPLLVLAHFGEFSSADYDTALDELMREGRVFCRWSPANAPADEAGAAARRVPGQQDFLEFLQPQTRPVWRRGG
ncbi:MAG TPA: hypothetical protein VH540_23035 [Ktedonobacterales bacterium]